MEQLYSSLKKCSLLFVFGLIGYAGFAQPSPCGPIVQDFNNTGGTMAGFVSSSSVPLSTSPGFTYGITGQNGYLQRCNIPSAGASYVIVSPTYQSLAAATTIGWGFTLSGDVEAEKIEVSVLYIDNNGDIAPVSVYTNTSTPYTGSGANRQLTVCETTNISDITGFTAGEKFRIAVEITAETSSNNNQCIIFDDFRVTGTIAQAPLPVSFVGFGAKKMESGIQLIWNVAGERDVVSYQVERSTNGRDFTKLGEVTANNSTTYSFIDRQPANGLAFYRIKEIDVDGKFKYSTIVRLNLDVTFGLKAYPSPARDLVTIEHGITSKGKLSITTSDGRVVRQIDLKPELSQTVINISNLQAGLYIIRFANDNGQTETTKLIKE
jgi:hypothetical protein